MRSNREINAVLTEFEQNISDHGWDCALDAAAKALYWVVGREINIKSMLDRPDVARRREWVARGGKSEYWPEKGDDE